MCLVLPSRVVGLVDQRAEIELPDGVRATVDATLVPQLCVGDHVLVDRGMVLKVISEEEAQTILAMYAEFGDMMMDSEPLVSPFANG